MSSQSKSVVKEIKEKCLEFKVMVYPGADEVGMSLMTRAYNDYYQVHKEKMTKPRKQ